MLTRKVTETVLISRGPAYPQMWGPATKKATFYGGLSYISGSHIYYLIAITLSVSI